MTYFLAALDRGGISKAAEELNVAPSAVSAAIDQVEAEFGVALVTRYRARGISPTAPGRTLAEKIRRLVDEYDALMLEGGNLRTALSGTLRIGYYAPVAPAFLPGILKPLVDENPGLGLSLSECDNETVQTGLLDGRFDVILFVPENVRAGIDREVLVEAPPYLLIPKGHGLTNRPVIALEDLAEEALVLLDLPFVGGYVRDLLTAAGIAPPIHATASTTEMVRSLVGAGLGCAILNMRPAIETSYGGDGLAMRPLAGKLRPLSLVMGTIAGGERRLVAAFRQACRDYFANNGDNHLVIFSPSMS
ncbi:MAG: LysR family transcriptional regulator [Pseudomonadota bacterium]